MKKIYLLLIVTILQLSSYSQNGIISYSKQIFFPKLKTMDKNQNEYMKNKISESLNKLEYILQFNNLESVFEINKNLDLDNPFAKLASSLSGGKGVYYTNKNEKGYLHQIETYGNLFLIRYDNINWQISNETKKIGKYLCYKATTIKTIKSIKTYKKVVTAWYCPELPYSFGPIGYGGLPGLILELKIEKGATFTVKKIKLNNLKKLNIKKPSKGKTITENQYIDIGRDMYNKRKEGF